MRQLIFVLVNTLFSKIKIWKNFKEREEIVTDFKKNFRQLKSTEGDLHFKNKYGTTQRALLYRTDLGMYKNTPSELHPVIHS